jgi:hypothetical protein
MTSVNLYRIIKGDFLQRTRSYAFLITMAITLWTAYTFVPPPDAAYSTFTITGFKGAYNSAWVGHVSAMMLNITIFLFGFFLVNNSISNDIRTQVGQIAATTSISNFGYILAKTLSNFIVLLAITGVVFLGNIIFYLWRSGLSDFNIFNFILPYALVVLPLLWVVATMAIVAEVFLRRYLAVQYMGWFFLFSFAMASVMNADNTDGALMMDVFGTKTITSSVHEAIKVKFDAKADGVFIGYQKNDPAAQAFKAVIWNGVQWNFTFILSRVLWIAVCFGMLFLSAKFFHRFDLTPKQPKAKSKVSSIDKKTINLNKPTLLPSLVSDFSVWPFVKTELKLMLRKGPSWLWVASAGIWISLWFVKISVAHQVLLPLLWFVQIGRIADLTTKEKDHRVHYFSFACYKPLQRMLPAQLLAAFLLFQTLAFPLLLRLAFANNLMAVTGIALGALFIIALSAALGVITQGKKVFEIIFFILTYVIIQKSAAADYLGAFTHENPFQYLSTMFVLCILFVTLCISVRAYQLQHD